VARVLIFEPHDDISALFKLVVRRLGHEPVDVSEGAVDLSAIDAAVIEPGEPGGMRLAIRMRAQGTPIVFASIFPSDSATQALQPAAYLVKPFPLYQLEHVLANTLTPHQAAAGL
jgi:hypothetical protein